MTRTINRWLIVLAGVTGLLALAPTAAHAYILANHAEPVRRMS
jgi:hypothetical protein